MHELILVISKWPLPMNVSIADATDFNATFQAGTGTGLPDLAEPGETIRGKPVLPLGTNVSGTAVWQIDSGWTMGSPPTGPSPTLFQCQTLGRDW